MQRAARNLALFFILGFLAQGTFAQTPAEAKRNGERAFSNERWRDAQMFLAQYQEAKPGDFGVLTKLGIALYQLRRGEEARRYLEYVAAKNPNSEDSELFYYLARTRHGLAEWEKAIVAYKVLFEGQQRSPPPSRQCHRQHPEVCGGHASCSKRTSCTGRKPG
jgi:tetratricopeptide (TPR) repeat protein